ESKPAAARAGETDGFYVRVRYQRATQCMRIAVQQREYPVGQVAPAHSLDDSLRHEIARAGMRRMALHDNRAAGRESRRRVTARDGESQRKITGPEHRHGT